MFKNNSSFLSSSFQFCIFKSASIIQQIGLQNNNNGVCVKNIPWQVTRLLGIIRNDYLYQKSKEIFETNTKQL